MSTNRKVFIGLIRNQWMKVAILLLLSSSLQAQTTTAPLIGQQAPAHQASTPQYLRSVPADPVAPSMTNAAASPPPPTHRTAGPPTGEPAKQQRIDHIMATATLGGTFNEAGISLANLINTSRFCQMQIGITPVATAGTRENMALLASGDVELAVLQSYAAQASPQAPQHAQLRTVTALWSNVEHFMIRTELAKTGTVEDFRSLYGRRVYIGARESGSEGSTRAILKALGIDSDQFDTSFAGSYAQAAAKLIGGELDGASLPGGMPVSAVDQVLAALGKRVRLLSFSKDQIQRVLKATDNTWIELQLAANVYPGLTEPVQSIAQPVLLVATPKVGSRYVHCLLELIYRGQPQQHGVGIHPVLARLSLADAFPPTLSYPLHDGACVFSAEQGLSVPENVRPPGGCAALIQGTGADAHPLP